jgi:hypothetical protein
VKEFAVYTLARFGIFVGCYVAVLGLVAAVAGRDAASGIWPLLVAVLGSAVISVYALRGMRERFTHRVYARADRIATNNRRD